MCWWHGGPDSLAQHREYWLANRSTVACFKGSGMQMLGARQIAAAHAVQCSMTCSTLRKPRTSRLRMLSSFTDQKSCVTGVTNTRKEACGRPCQARANFCAENLHADSWRAWLSRRSVQQVSV